MIKIKWINHKDGKFGIKINRLGNSFQFIITVGFHRVIKRKIIKNLNEIETISINHFFSTSDLKKIINQKGKENIRFIAPFKTQAMLTPLGFMTSSNDPVENVLCKITETKYKVDDWYKISLTPAEYNWYNEEYYIEDLTSLIEKGIIKIVK